jgi:hypothetical protein
MRLTAPQSHSSRRPRSNFILAMQAHHGVDRPTSQSFFCAYLAGRGIVQKYLGQRIWKIWHNIPKLGTGGRKVPAIQIMSSPRKKGRDVSRSYDLHLPQRVSNPNDAAFAKPYISAPRQRCSQARMGALEKGSMFQTICWHQSQRRTIRAIAIIKASPQARRIIQWARFMFPRRERQL